MTAWSKVNACGLHSLEMESPSKRGLPIATKDACIDAETRDHEFVIDPALREYGCGAKVAFHQRRTQFWIGPKQLTELPKDTGRL